jgi:DNA-binding MarR family transcriptional regulator
MFKDGEEGKISMPNKELSKKINMPESTISKVNKSLVSKEYATIVSTHNRDPETGLFIKEKFYHLTKLEQAIVFILKNHEDRITENTEDIKDLKEKNQSLEENLQTTQKDLQMALRRIAELEKQNKHGDIVL